MKKVLVTGGTKGIGFSVAKHLVESGHEVVVCSRICLVHSSPILWGQCDASSTDSIIGFLSDFGNDFDIVVNNVGGGGTWEDWHGVYQKNVNPMLRFTQACLPHMLEKRWGRVVTITSLGNDNPGFNMAKKAQEAFMLTMSRKREYAANNITFNCVAPGRIAVGKEQDVNKDYLDSLPMGRLGTPQEVANVVAFLCSPEASLINGAVIKCGDVL